MVSLLSEQREIADQILARASGVPSSCVWLAAMACGQRARSSLTLMVPLPQLAKRRSALDEVVPIGGQEHVFAPRLGGQWG